MYKCMNTQIREKKTMFHTKATIRQCVSNELHFTRAIKTMRNLAINPHIYIYMNVYTNTWVSQFQWYKTTTAPKTSNVNEHKITEPKKRAIEETMRLEVY